MNVIVFSSNPNVDGLTATCVAAASKGVQQAAGQVDQIRLNDLNIASFETCDNGWGTWKAAPINYRQEYGKELLMIGGFDKRILAQSKEDIVQEIYCLTPLVEEGGFIPFCDHRVPPDVPYENYLYYLEKSRELWGKDLNLNPAQWKAE